MKRLVLFGVVIFLVIIGGFLVVDKVWLHKIFVIKPGSCLILEEKYCKKGKIKYIDNKPAGIVYEVDKKTALFVPMTDNYILDKTTTNDNLEKNNFLIGGDIKLENPDVEKNGYQIIFDGKYETEIIKNTNKKITKSNVFAYTNNDKAGEVILIPFLNKTIKTDFGNSITFTKDKKVNENEIEKLTKTINKNEK